MAKLLLDSLEVAGFRGFRHIEIPHLGRVNLIVGKNNIGKSSLLEALRLFAARGSASVVRSLLGSRDEMRGIPRSRQETARQEAADIEDPLLAVRYLFYGRPDLRNAPQPIKIGSMTDATETITISVRRRAIRTEEVAQLSMFPPDEDETVGYRGLSDLALTIAIDDRARYGYSIDSLIRRYPVGLETDGLTDISSIFVPANGLSSTLYNFARYSVAGTHSLTRVCRHLLHITLKGGCL